ncbi:MAG: hypothetical protein J6563_00770 [Gilliamella sp.]|uniref:DUF6246 family protein n=1 Tax=Gilliamella sp. TaxID=1891236 RepID=UPI002635013C|nr:DUF6246 family protein [Gilliamella sp.]MCO6551494.1 hypothetical protein [Gilliamella sp.]
MIRTDIGEIAISIKKNGTLSCKNIDYVFTPSFDNLSKLGEPSEMVNAYVVLLSNDAYEVVTRLTEPNEYIIQYVEEKFLLQLATAKKILKCCCSEDVSPLIGTRNKSGLMQNQDILLIARSLLDYGVAGRAKIRISQRNENKTYSSEFKISDYINNARVHLGLSLDEAKKLTMTEYILLMANKYPDNEGLTSQEYDAVVASYKQRRAEQLKQAEKSI